MRIKEVAVPRLYLDPNRAFGGTMNDAEQRLAYYRRVIQTAENERRSCPPSCCSLPGPLPRGACS
jgi:dolichol-phosphate mannosyltransferase